MNAKTIKENDNETTSMLHEYIKSVEEGRVTLKDAFSKNLNEEVTL